MPKEHLFAHGQSMENGYFFNLKSNQMERGHGNSHTL